MLLKPEQLALYWTGVAMYGLTLNATNNASLIHNWMVRPHPNDLVIELTSRGKPRGSNNETHIIGKLIKIEQVWKAWGDGDPEGYWDKITTIKTLEDEVVKWTDCQFVRIPRNGRFEMECTSHSMSPATIPETVWLCKASCNYCSGVFPNG